MKIAVHNFGLVIGLLLGAVSCPLHAAEVAVERIHEEPKTLQEDPQDYLKITIGKQVFHSASLGDWRILSDYSGMDLAAFPPNDRSVMVGLKIEPCVNAEGKNYSCFTPELLAALLKRLKPEGPQYEGKDPVLSESANVMDLYFRACPKASRFSNASGKSGAPESFIGGDFVFGNAFSCLLATRPRRAP